MKYTTIGKFLVLTILVLNVDLNMCINSQSQQSLKHQLGYSPFPKKIWAYWSSQMQMKGLQHLFLTKFFQFLSKPENKGWNFIFLTDQNMPKYITKFQEYKKTYQKSDIITPANKADIVRLFILEEHGGVYFDITTSFIGDLRWLQLQNLLKNPLVVNKHPIDSPQPDVLLFYGAFHQYRNHYYDQYENLRNDFPGFESWFIASKPNAKFISDWKQKLKQYYSASAKFIFSDMRQNDIYFSNFYYQTYHNVYLALYYILQKKQSILDKNTTLFKRYYSNLDYKVWAINCDCGPCSTYGQKIVESQYPFYFFTKSQGQLSKLFGLSGHLRLFVKFTHYHLVRFRQVIQASKNPIITNMSLIQYYELSPSTNCNNFSLYLGQGSFVYNYLFKNNQQIKIKYFTRKQIQDFRLYCDNKGFKEVQWQIFSEFIHRLRLYDPKTNIDTIVLFIVVIYIVLVLIIYKMCCCPSYNQQAQWSICHANQNQSKYQKDLFRPQNQRYHISHQYIEKLAMKVDCILKSSLKIQVSYYLIAGFYLFISIYNFLIMQILSFRDQHLKVFIVFVSINFLKSLSQIHPQKSYPKSIKIIFSTISQYCIIKIVIEQIYNQPNYWYFGTIYVGLLGLKAIQIFQKDQLLCLNLNFIRSYKQTSRIVHQNALVITLGLFAFLPNLKYYKIGDTYLAEIFLYCFIIYIWAIIVVLIGSELINYFRGQVIQKTAAFYYTKHMLSSYSLTLVLSLFYQQYWFILYIPELMNTRRFLLLSTILLISSSTYPYQNSTSSSVFSLFMVFIGVVYAMITFFYKKIQAGMSDWFIMFTIFCVGFGFLAIFKLVCRVLEDNCCVRIQKRKLSM